MRSGRVSLCAPPRTPAARTYRPTLPAFLGCSCCKAAKRPAQALPAPRASLDADRGRGSYETAADCRILASRPGVLNSPVDLGAARGPDRSTTNGTGTETTTWLRLH